MTVLPKVMFSMEIISNINKVIKIEMNINAKI